MCKVGQNRISAPYMTVCMVISLLKYCMYTVYTYKCIILANPSDVGNGCHCLRSASCSFFKLSSLFSLVSSLSSFSCFCENSCDWCIDAHMLPYTHAVIYTCCHIHRAGQNRIYAPYMTVYSVISLPNIPYTHRIYMVLANPTFAHAVIYTCCHIHMLPYRQMSCT